MKPVLLLVDLQRDYLGSPGLEPSAEILVSRVTALLHLCRERQIPAIHIWTTVRREEDRRLPHWRRANRWMCVQGTAGHEPPEALRPRDNEMVVHKTGFNAFADPTLEQELRAPACDSVVIVGLHLHACVRTLALECLERGFQVRIVDDAVASNDPIHAAAVRRWLAERCVDFVPAHQAFSDRDQAAAPVYLHRSPRISDEILFEVPVSGENEVNHAVATARDAWTDWRRIPSPARQAVLDEVAGRLEAAATDLARQLAVEIGKPFAHGLEEVCRTATNIRDVLRRATGHSDSRREGTGLVRRQPLGVVGIITPWNNPVAIPLGKIVPALVYGNTVVWKPAPAATRIAQSLLHLLQKLHVPAGTVQLVTGDHTTAQRIAGNESINAVTFTGSLTSGHAIQEICARRVIPLQAELSGNNAAIVWDDADLPHAAQQVAWGAFGFAGQRCTASRRVIVPGARFEDFLSELQVSAERLNWGEPLEPATEIGPLINTTKRDEHVALISRAQTCGAAHRVVRLQQARADEPWVGNGAYAQPVIACCDQADHALVQEETMSPLLVVQRAADFEQALALCNGVRHGLAAALFSRSADLQQTFLAEARAGILKFNSSTAGVDVTLPFGGWKTSGLGPPEHGVGDGLFYTRIQAVYGSEDSG